MENAVVARTASDLRIALGALHRRMRQTRALGEVPLPALSALSRLDRGGPATTAELARREQISPQSMGATIALLEQRRLVERAQDPSDRRRAILFVTRAGARVLSSRRDERTQQLARAIASEFSGDELAQLRAAVPLIERLAQRLQ
jgi:DNA-binding MarR family transcriptional regulator